MGLRAFYHPDSLRISSAAISFGGANRVPDGRPEQPAMCIAAALVHPASSAPPAAGVAVSSLARLREMNLRRVLPMIFVAAHLAVFWRLPWSEPLRAALRFAPRQPDEHWLPQPVSDAPLAAPGWLRPLCVQRWWARPSLPAPPG
jgi:hypothetical protein